MSDAIAASPNAIEKTDRAIVARPRAKILEEDALKALGRAIDDASAGEPRPPAVVIDLSGVGVFPSLALGLMVQIGNKCRARQQRLALAAVPPHIRQVFAITRLDRVFQFADTVDAALA